MALKARRDQLQYCFDASKPDSRPSPPQWTVFNDIEKIQFRYLVSANQIGKSSMGAREIAWIVNDNHPTWKRPARWGIEPLLVIIAGKGRDIMEKELWNKKLKPFLVVEDWKEQRVSGQLIAVKNRKTEDQILFIPHGDSSDGYIERMQSYVAHYVWLDEMPVKAKVFTELQNRVRERGGYMLTTFTPLSANSEIRRIVDGSDGIDSKKYQLSYKANPKYNDPEEERKLLALASTWPVRERAARLYGEWYLGDQAVYEFDRDKMCVERLPAHYSPHWRHLQAVDPALSSKTGHSIWAEDPKNGTWYCIEASYLQEKDPVELLQVCKRKGQGYNIVRRVSDTAPWFYALAHKESLSFLTPYKKNERKDELIKGLQNALTSGKVKILSSCTDLIEEFETCRWSENAEEKIIGSQRFHTLDAAQYAVDLLPKYEGVQEVKQTPMEHIYNTWLKEKENKIKKQASSARMFVRRRR